MNFLIHDENGRVYQSNQIQHWRADPSNGRKEHHTETLANLGQQFVAVDHHAVIDPTKVWVETRRKLVRARQAMPATLRSKTVKAGPANPAVIDTEVPNIKVTVYARGFSQPVGSMTVDKGPIEVELPVPGVYRIELERWPFLDWQCDVEVS